VVAHENDAPLLGGVDQSPAFGKARRERLLNQHMLARLDCCHRDLEMGGRRRSDSDRIDHGVIEEPLQVIGDLDARVGAGQPRGATEIHVADRRERCRWRLKRVADEIGSPISRADYGHNDRCRGRFELVPFVSAMLL
jgi:hypothetical protein